MIKALKASASVALDMLGYDPYDPHEGTLGRLVTIKGQLYYTMQWATVVKVPDDQPYSDDPVETIIFSGTEITEEDFDILEIGDKDCVQCDSPLEFESGHEYASGTDDIICVHCVTFNNKMLNKVLGNC
jgi:hypothetical protein